MQGSFPPHKRAHCAVEVMKKAAERPHTAEARFISTVGCVALDSTPPSGELQRARGRGLPTSVPHVHALCGMRTPAK